jgi:RHS repeat-associated protein
VWIDRGPKAPINGYLFSGKPFDPETGFYDFGQRFYDPRTSLWLGVDPKLTGEPGSAVGRSMLLSPFAYAAHSPFRFVDPDGRQARPRALELRGTSPRRGLGGECDTTACKVVKGIMVAPWILAGGWAAAEAAPVVGAVASSKGVQVTAFVLLMGQASNENEAAEVVTGYMAAGLVAKGIGAAWRFSKNIFGFGTNAAREGTHAINISTAGRTAEEAEAIREYARRTNAWLGEAGPQTVRSTQGALRREASAATRAERLRAARAGQPYQGQAGHVPDTAVSGQAQPPAGWLDMPGVSNSACGGVLGCRVGQTVDHFTVDGVLP